MIIEVKNQEHLKKTIYTFFMKYDDCSIELYDPTGFANIFFSTMLLGHNKRLLSLSIKDKSAGNVIDKNSTFQNELKKWVDFSTEELIFDDPLKMSVLIKSDLSTCVDDDVDDEDFEEDTDDEELDGYDRIYDYREEYLTKHNKIRIMQNPIKIDSCVECVDAFKLFLENNRINKLILSFSVYIKDLDHLFIIDFVVDKLYVLGRTLISGVVSRPDVGDLEFVNNRTDFICEYTDKRGDKYIKSLIETFTNVVLTCYAKCSFVSDEKEKIDVLLYSNQQIERIN